MTSSSRTPRLEDIFDAELVARLMQMVAPQAAKARRTALHIMPLAWRIGHLAMEPHAFWELYGETHDQLILLLPDKNLAPQSLGVREMAEQVTVPIETKFTRMLLMGHTDAGIISQANFTWYQRGPTGILDDYIKQLNATGRHPRKLPLPETVRQAAATFCERRGIGPDDKLVVLNVRDCQFLPDQPTHFYRTARIKTYEAAIRRLLECGYWVLRLGVDGSDSAEIDDPKYVEVWREPDYSTLLDPGLISRSSFGITCSSGPEAIFRVLGTPQVMVNGVLQCSMWMSPGDLLLFKSYRSDADGKPAKLHDLLQKGVAISADRDKIRELGYSVEDNTSAQIDAAVAEMMERAADPATLETSIAPPERTRFLELGADYQRFLESGGHPRDPVSLSARPSQFGYALPWTRLSQINQEANPAFLD